MAFRVGGVLFVTAAMAVAAACGGSSPESQPASTAAPAAEPAADHTAHPGGGKVYFMEPKDGASVKSPVHVVFGSDMFTIAAVPPGEIAPEAVRAEAQRIAAPLLSSGDERLTRELTRVLASLTPSL